MEFLYKLYDHEYFGIGLFIVITVLTLLFLIILFFGKKDEKQRKLEETNRLELEQNAFKESNEGIKELSVPEIEQPILQPEVPVENISNGMIDIPVIEKTVEVPAISEEVEPMPAAINLDDMILNDNISEVNVNINEPVAIDETSFKVEEPVVENIDVNALFQTDLNNINFTDDNVAVNNEISLELPELSEVKEENEINPFIIEEIPIEENLTSVVEETSVIQEEPKKIENPFELPKLNDDNNKDARITDFDSLFGNIESETYNLNK